MLGLNTDKDKAHWFVMHSLTSVMRMEEDLKRNNLECYLPKKVIVKKNRYGSHLQTIPVIEFYIFVHAKHSEIEEFKSKGHYLAFLRDRTKTTHSTLKVSDKEMEDFIKVSSMQENKARIFAADEIEIPKGQQIRITGGILNGVVGTLVKLKGLRDKRLVVSIPGVAHATVPVEKTFIQFV